MKEKFVSSTCYNLYFAVILFELPIAVLRWTANTDMLPVILLLVLLTVIGYMKGKDRKKQKYAKITARDPNQKKEKLLQKQQKPRIPRGFLHFLFTSSSPASVPHTRCPPGNVSGNPDKPLRSIHSTHSRALPGRSSRQGSLLCP